MSAKLFTARACHEDYKVLTSRVEETLSIYRISQFIFIVTYSSVIFENLVIADSLGNAMSLMKIPDFILISSKHVGETPSPRGTF